MADDARTVGSAFRCCFALPHHCHPLGGNPLSISLSRFSLSTHLLSPALPHASCLSPAHHPRCAYHCHNPPSAHCLASIPDGLSSPNTERYRLRGSTPCSTSLVLTTPALRQIHAFCSHLYHCASLLMQTITTKCRTQPTQRSRRPPQRNL